MDLDPALVDACRRTDGSVNTTRLAALTGIPRSTIQGWVQQPKAKKEKHPEESGPPMPGYLEGPAVTITSLPDNTFIFGAFGDLHAGSKYCRWDVRESLVRRAEDAGAQAIFDTGNWLDGEA